MKIEKILNNNVVTTIDPSTHQEKVVMGRGLAFKKKTGERIDQEKIEKIFLIQDQNENRRFQGLMQEIPMEFVEVAEEIIEYSKETLKVEFHEHVYVALTDHIAFAIDRSKNNLKIENHLLWEIQRVHPKEYQVGLWATQRMNEKFKVDLTEDEAGFIALHLINGTIGKNMTDTMNLTKITQDLLNIIKYHFNIDLDNGDFAYDQLVTHLKHFSVEILSNKEIHERKPLPEAVLEGVKTSYPRAYQCTMKINKYIEKNYSYQMNQHEILYFIVYLNKIVLDFIED